MMPPIWLTPARGPVCGPMLVTKMRFCASLNAMPRGARPPMTNASQPSIRPPTIVVGGDASRSCATTWFSVGLPGRDVDDRDVRALDVGDVEARVGRVGHHAARVHADVDGGEQHGRVAVGAGDVEHLHLVEVLVAQVGARPGAVELDLGLHAEPARARRATRPVTRASSVSVAVSMIETESSKRFTTQARDTPPPASRISTWNGLSPTGMPWMPAAPASWSTNCPVPVLKTQSSSLLLRRHVELRRARPGADAGAVRGARAARAVVAEPVRRRDDGGRVRVQEDEVVEQRESLVALQAGARARPGSRRRACRRSATSGASLAQWPMSGVPERSPPGFIDLGGQLALDARGHRQPRGHERRQLGAATRRSSAASRAPRSSSCRDSSSCAPGRKPSPNAWSAEARWRCAARSGRPSAGPACRAAAGTRSRSTGRGTPRRTADRTARSAGSTTPSPQVGGPAGGVRADDRGGADRHLAADEVRRRPSSTSGATRRASRRRAVP